VELGHRGGNLPFVTGCTGVTADGQLVGDAQSHSWVGVAETSGDYVDRDAR